MKDKVYVLDTNIILQNVQNLNRISDNNTNIIVIPETVLLELEDKKKLTTELGYYSREFARLLANMKIKEVDYKAGFKVVKLYNDELNLHIISKDKYDVITSYSIHYTKLYENFSSNEKLFTVSRSVISNTI